MRKFLSRFEIVNHLLSVIILLPKYFQFFIEFFSFKKNSNNRFPVEVADLFPQLHDRTSDHGYDRHYVYHTAWAARILKKIKPKVHTDISSSLYFSAISSAWVKFKLYDFRPVDLRLDNLKSASADLTHLSFPSGSIASLSCMHTLEHIGLGRYGDPIDPEGDRHAMKELKRVLAKNGNLLIVVPVGKPKVMFNAHRIYSYLQVIENFRGLTLREFSLVPDEPNAHLIRNASPSLVKKQAYACGCFWFTKKR